MRLALIARVRLQCRSASALARLVLVLVALAYGWGSFANLVSTAHDPARWAGHDNAPLLAAQSAAHDHDHDHHHDDDAPETDVPQSDAPQGDAPQGDHQHGHHGADHSHDKSALARTETRAVLSLPEAWDAASPLPAYPAPCFAFERPPKRVSMT